MSFGRFPRSMQKYSMVYPPMSKVFNSYIDNHLLILSSNFKEKGNGSVQSILIYKKQKFLYHEEQLLRYEESNHLSGWWNVGILLTLKLDLKFTISSKTHQNELLSQSPDEITQLSSNTQSNNSVKFNSSNKSVISRTNDSADA